MDFLKRITGLKESGHLDSQLIREIKEKDYEAVNMSGLSEEKLERFLARFRKVLLEFEKKRASGRPVPEDIHAKMDNLEKQMVMRLDHIERALQVVIQDEKFADEHLKSIEHAVRKM